MELNIFIRVPIAFDDDDAFDSVLVLIPMQIDIGYHGITKNILS